MSNVALKWMGGNSRLFVTRDSFGNVVPSGSWPEDSPDWMEFKAAKPSDLLLMGLSACSAHDVVSILQRQRQQLDNLYIEVEGKQEAEAPWAFTDIHLHVILEGKDLDPKKVSRAVDLAINKYCAVAATIRGVANLTHSIEIRE